MIPNPTGNPLGMLDFGGIWGFWDPSGLFPGIPRSRWGGGSFSSEIHLFLLFLGFVCFPWMFFFPFGNVPGFVGKEAIPESWNPGGPWEGHSDTGPDIPKGAGRGKTLEKRREKEEKKKFFLWQRNNDPKKPTRIGKGSQIPAGTLFLKKKWENCAQIPG